MGRFLLRRVLQLVPTLFIIVSLSFFIIRLAPGSPFASERALPPEVLRDLEAKYGFDRPLLQQYGTYLSNLVRFDLGMSTKYPQMSVSEIIGLGFPVTLQLAAVALVWALLIGVNAGIIGALRQNTAWDHGAMALAMIGISLPTFVLGPLLILTFALTLYLFPPGLWGTWRHIILPGITLGSVYAAYVARLTRGGMLEVVRSDFVRTARAKGLSELLITWRHMLKGGLLPVVTFLGPTVANMMVGSVVIEKIFATPGIGPYLVDAAFNRDYFLVMGIVLLFSVLLLTMNLLVDVAYGLLDPRIRYE
jgi:oligopeptide transport system permease protein